MAPMASTKSVSEQRADLDKAPEDVAAMFDVVAPRYDITNDLLSLGMVFVWRKATRRALDLGQGDLVLDVAAGTGTSSAHLQKTGATVIALDLSEGMIEVGRSRHPDIEFVLGSATDLPFDNDTFDAVTISYGIRNIDDVPRALAEFYRVTRPGGRLVICEFSKPNDIVKPPYDLYMNQVAPLIAKVASPAGAAYDYLSESIDDWYDQKTLGLLMQRAGWRHVAYRNQTFGAVAIHRGFKPGSRPHSEPQADLATNLTADLSMGRQTGRKIFVS